MGVYGCSCVCGWGRRSVCVRSRVDRDRTCDVMQPIFDHDEEEDIQVRVGWMCVRAEGWHGGRLSVCLCTSWYGHRPDLGCHAARLWRSHAGRYSGLCMEGVGECIWVERFVSLPTYDLMWTLTRSGKLHRLFRCVDWVCDPGRTDRVRESE